MSKNFQLLSVPGHWEISVLLKSVLQRQRMPDTKVSVFVLKPM